jgi:hypothetical protein
MAGDVSSPESERDASAAFVRITSWSEFNTDGDVASLLPKAN